MPNVVFPLELSITRVDGHRERYIDIDILHLMGIRVNGHRERERENYICFSHLGLIRWRTGTPQEIETIRDESSDRNHVL
jgi:hypothetical protein